MNNELSNDVKVNRRTALLAGIALVLLLTAGWLFKIYEDKQSQGNNTPAPTSNVTTSVPDNSSAQNNSPAAPTVDTLNQQIQSNPTDPNLYAQKSEILYNAGDKAGALSVVNEGLATNPDSEILKSKKDILEKDYFQSGSTDTPRQ